MLKILINWTSTELCQFH